MLVAASTDILLDMVSKLNNPDVALVHQMPFTTDQPGFAHAIEKVCSQHITHRTSCNQLKSSRLRIGQCHNI